jgi:hypothetical protein
MDYLNFKDQVEELKMSDWVVHPRPTVEH